MICALQCDWNDFTALLSRRTCPIHCVKVNCVNLSAFSDYQSKPENKYVFDLGYGSFTMPKSLLPNHPLHNCGDPCPKRLICIHSTNDLASPVRRANQQMQQCAETRKSSRTKRKFCLKKFVQARLATIQDGDSSECYFF